MSHCHVTTLVIEDRESCGYITDTNDEAYSYLDGLSDALRVTVSVAYIYRAEKPTFCNLGTHKKPELAVTRDNRQPEAVRIARRIA